jgi:hypothetical protein
MRDIKIGITFCENNLNSSAYVTGILQNAVNLATLLKQSDNNYEVILVNTAILEGTGYYSTTGDSIRMPKEPFITDKKFLFNLYDYPIVSYYDIWNSWDLDVLIIMGGEIVDNEVEVLTQKKNTKVVYYNCGARYQYFILEGLIKNKEGVGKPGRSISSNYSAIWCIPQNYEKSNYFYRILQRTNPISIPFIYDPKFIDDGLASSGVSKDDAMYKPTGNPKRISVIEVNREWLKNFIYPTLIVESVFRKFPELIGQISINNLRSISDNTHINDFLVALNLWKSDSIKRYLNDWMAIYDVLPNYTDIVVSHQWSNPLNYSYLDCFYLEYPLIHNAYMCKDAGYYYDSWNFDLAEEQLIQAIKFHDNNIEKYRYRCQKVLARFSPYNQTSIDIYDKLIDDLFK